MVKGAFFFYWILWIDHPLDSTGFDRSFFIFFNPEKSSGSLFFGIYTCKTIQSILRVFALDSLDSLDRPHLLKHPRKKNFKKNEKSKKIPEEKRTVSGLKIHWIALALDWVSIQRFCDPLDEPLGKKERALRCCNNQIDVGII